MTSATHQLTAADVMQTDVVTAKPTTTLHEACQAMLANHVSGLPVVDVQGCCIGVVTATDIVEFLDARCDSEPRRRHRFNRYFNECSQQWEYVVLEDDPPNELDEHEVCEAMSRPVGFVTEDTPVKTVAARMKSERQHRIMVLGEGNALKGIISSFDFVTLAAE